MEGCEKRTGQASRLVALQHYIEEKKVIVDHYYNKAYNKGVGSVNKQHPRLALKKKPHAAVSSDHLLRRII